MCDAREFATTVSPRRRPRQPAREHVEPIGPWGQYVNDIRVSNGWSYEQMWKPLNQVARDDGEPYTRFNRHSIRNAIAGRVPRDGRTLGWMVKAWGRTVSEMSLVVEEHRKWRYRQRTPVRRAQTTSTPQPPEQPDAIAALIPSVVETEPVPSEPAQSISEVAGNGRESTERRTILVGTFGILASIPMRFAFRDAATNAIEQLLTFQSDPNVETIEALEGVVHQLGEQYSRTPPAIMYNRLEGVLGAVRDLAQQAPPRHSRTLQSTAGWLTAMLANALYDLTDTVAAEATAIAATQYAQYANDARLSAFIHDRKAMRAENAGRLRHALEQFQASISYAPPDSAVRVRALAASARVHATLGHHDMARASMSNAEKEYGRLPSSEIGDGSLSVSSIAVTDAISSATELRGDADAAIGVLQQTIDYYSNLPLSRQRPTRLSLAHLRMANIYANTRDPDQASAHTLIALSTSRIVLPVLLRADHLSALLNQQWPKQRNVQDLRDRLRSLVDAMESNE